MIGIMDQQAPVVMYCTLMEDVKTRIALVRRFTSGEIRIGSEQFAYECVSTPTSRCVMIYFLCGWMNSIGSSIVTMCPASSVLR